MHDIMRNKKSKFDIPEFDPQTGDRNPHLGELKEIEKTEDTSTSEVVVDMNQFSLDSLVNMLEAKYQVQSNGDAHAIMRLVEFYKENK